ncbi:MAG: nucleoside-diphosphate sugar epimerase [Deltaproteobacteria bacterium]|nr:nucleoside-diphosphate sugar epimerase [Deltaproteobacteria bacterium]
MVFLDFIFILAAYFLSYLLRFEGNIPPWEWINFVITVPYILILKLLIFWFWGLYRGMWRYTGLVDLLNVFKAAITSSAIIGTAIFLISGFEGFPRSVFILDCLMTFILIGGCRVAIRLILFEKDKGFRFVRRFLFRPTGKDFSSPQKRIVIIGAGDAGEKILREIRDNPRLQYRTVGFLDDDERKKGMKIHGVPVSGPISQVQKMATQGAIDEILIAIPSASATNMRRIIEVCKTTGLKFRTTPALGELINGKISFDTIREVSFEDLLRRDPVKLDMERIGRYLTGKIVLVSGAGGSIGSELCRQISSFGPRNLVLLDKTENSLFHVEMEFRQKFPEILITPVLGNVNHQGFLNQLFEIHRPQVVFHAAAYKHVPIVELNPWEAIFNNARFVSVRFGNVIGSEGSVIHLFRKQIKNLGPVTITHPEVSRYFMTISEACKLILQAGAQGKGGEIFILNMGTPIKIVDLARDLIRLSGFQPDVEIEIKFIGLRPGEKLFEELIIEGEGIVPTSHDKIFALRGNYSDSVWLKERIEELRHLAMERDAIGIKTKLQEMIPEYRPFDEKEHQKASATLPPLLPARLSTPAKEFPVGSPAQV